MKNKFKLLVLIFSASLIVGCTKSYFYPGINTSPTSVSQANLTPTVLLSGAEASIGFTVGGDISRFSSIFTQYAYGGDNQFIPYSNYQFASSDFETPWDNIFTQGLGDLASLKTLSQQKGYNYYEGVSDVLLAYEYGVATDFWGDIPYSQAEQGGSNLQPKYDSQQNIYDSLLTLLNTAVTKLSASASGPVPGNDDVIYGGNIANWIAFANSLKARYDLHLSKINTSYAQNVLADLNGTGGAFTSSAQNAAVQFFNVETFANPTYQFQESRNGYLLYSPTPFTIGLTALNDPRVAAYVDTVGQAPTNLVAGIATPVTLLSYTEVLFMKAEAYSAINDVPHATSAYNAAVTNSFADAGVTMPTGYLTNNGLTGSTHAARLPQIIQQKYYALFIQTEPYNDWRRTGYPSLTPYVGAQIPRRFLYPQSELNTNLANVPTGITLYTHVWWDK